MTEFGGSLQCVRVRFTLLDATEQHSAGSHMYTDDVVRLTYGRRWTDGSYQMRVALVKPAPVLFQFVVGGDLIYQGDDLVGWAEPETLRPSRMAIDAWSINVINGAVHGYYRWSAPECSPCMFTGHALDGRNPAQFRAATTVNLKQGFRFTAEDLLPTLPVEQLHTVLPPVSVAA